MAVKLDRVGVTRSLEQLESIAASIAQGNKRSPETDRYVDDALSAMRNLQAARSLGGASLVSDAMQTQASAHLAAIRAGAEAAVHRVAPQPTQRVKSLSFTEAVDYLAKDGSVAMLVAGNGTKLGLDGGELPALTRSAEKVARFFARGARFNLVGGGDQLQSDPLKYDVSNARDGLRRALRDTGTRLLAFQSDAVAGSAWDVTGENDGGVCYVPSFKRDGTLATDAGDVVWGGRSVIEGREVLHGATWGYLHDELTSALDCRSPITAAALQEALSSGNATGLPRYALMAFGGGAITFDEMSLALERGMAVFYLPATPRAMSRDMSGAEILNSAVVTPGFRGDAALKVDEKLRSGEWVALPATALGVPEDVGMFLTLNR